MFAGYAADKIPTLAPTERHRLRARSSLEKVGGIERRANAYGLFVFPEPYLSVTSPLVAQYVDERGTRIKFAERAQPAHKLLRID